MVYRVMGSTMGNQGSTGYLVIQLLVVRAMSGLQRHTNCLLSRTVVSVIRALRFILIQCKEC